MPIDNRLYMTFPNDFWLHPKVAILSDAAFRAFVELNGYSRMQDLDGEVPVSLARKQWRPKALGELECNHPERPTLTVEGDNYVIRDYAQHQQTRAARAAQSATNSANGAKGGRPKSKRTETDSVSEPEANQKHSQSQSQSQSSETDVTKDYESSHLSNARAEDFDSESAAAKREGIHDLRAVAEVLSKAAGQPVSARGARKLTAAIVSKSKGVVRKVDAYVATTCRTSPAEVQQAYFDLDIGAYGEGVDE